mmetsp:Transcript_138157/g.350151  ORF Transcript_138157/g.350151 Transcript_138157/m.350151 type:complete len:553 (-) Transcript_138157:31-1689(-)
MGRHHRSSTWFRSWGLTGATAPRRCSSRHPWAAAAAASATRSAAAAVAAAQPAPWEERQFDPHGSMLAELLIECDATLLKVGYLRRLAQQRARLPRWQDLPLDHPEGLRDFRACSVLRGEELRRQLQGASELFVVSHAWLSAEHPDPFGSRLQELVEEFAVLRAKDCDLVFVDFCSLPQVDKLHEEYRRAHRQGRALPADHQALRTPSQEACFQKALARMDLIFASGISKVVVLPDLLDLDEMEDPYTPCRLEYHQRGWCCFEFAVALHFDRIVSEVPKKLRAFDPLSLPDMVHAGKVRFLVPHDTDKVLSVFERTFYARKKGELVAAISRGKAEQWREGIGIALKAYSPSVRRQIIQALGDTCAHGFMGDVSPAMEDVDCGVRAAAVAALTRMATSLPPHADPLGEKVAAHREALVSCLGDGLWQVREDAMVGLGQMNALDMHSHTVAESLDDPIPAARVSALSSLVKLGDSAGMHAEQVHRLAKDDQYAFVRDAATTTLEKLGRQDLLQELLEQQERERKANQKREVGGKESALDEAARTLERLHAQLCS